jgi:hypothetical protein
MAQFTVSTITAPLPAAADDVIIFKASGTGGKISILDAYAVNHATTSGTATFTLALHKRTAAGTVIAGTVGSLGGTADHWVDTNPKSFSVDSDYATLDEGECLSIAYAQVDGGSQTRGYVTVNYVQGKV